MMLLQIPQLHTVPSWTATYGKSPRGAFASALPRLITLFFLVAFAGAIAEASGVVIALRYDAVLCWP